MSTTPFSWTNEKVHVRETPYGKGVFAAADIAKGERVIAFGGYMLTEKGLTSLPKHLQEHPFQVADDLFFGQIAEHELSTADYLNHSCEPNSGFKGQAFVVAMRDIKAGEEITIDYVMCTSSKLLRDIECLCGTKSCRGMTRYDDWKTKTLQQKYAGYFQWYLEEKIRGSQK